MADDFFGGDFDELRRETEKLKRGAIEGQRVTQSYTEQVTSDKTEQRRIAERVRAATSRTVAEAETLVARGAATAQGEVTGGTRAVAQQVRATDSLARSTTNALRPLQQMRQWGPYAFTRSKQSLDSLIQSYDRLRRVGAFSTLGTPQLPTSASGAPNIQQQGRSAFAAAPGGFPLPVSRAGVGFVPPAPAAVQNYSAEVTRAATAHTVLNAQMERHGALSSEFIQQLARGNVGLRELGQNLLVTTGKFGGWLAAGAGLYTLIGAVGLMGSGAIDAATGVNQLKRVIANIDDDEAAAGFRELASQFNLPIGDIAEAQYEMGKVFNNQADSFEAARIAAAAVKVGELDVASATRYLTSITTGFNLEASQMSDVFGQVNAAQNTFGLNIEDTLAGLAGAAGAAKTLGGSTPAVLAFFTAARRGAGVSGSVTGTAVQRMTTFLQQNKEELKQFGIDVDSMDLDQILKKAFDIAPTLERQKLIELSQGLFGTFYGPRVGLPALRQGDVFNESLDTYRKSGEDTWQKELSTTLSSALETVKRIATELGNLGSNLASSGFLDLLLFGVYSLGQMLKLVNGIFGLFNELPAPLRHALSLMLQLYGVMRLMRRFQLGERFAPGSLPNRALTDPASAARRGATEELVVRRGELSNELVTASSQVTRAELERTIAMEQQTALARRQAGTSKEAASLADQSAGAHAQVANADLRVREARLREAAIARELQQTTAREAYIRQARGNPLVPGVLPYQTPPGVGSAVGVDTSQIAREMNSTSARLRRNINSYGVAGGAIATGVQGVATASRNARARMGRVNFTGGIASLRGLGTNLRGFAGRMVSMLGPLDAIVAAVATVALLAANSSQFGRRMQGYIDQIGAAENFADAQAAAASGARDADLGGFEWALQGFPSFGDQAEEVQKAYDESASHVANLKNQFVGGGPITDLAGAYPDVLEELATAIRTNLAQGEISVAEAAKQQQQIIDAAWKSPYIDDPLSFEQQIRGTATGDQVQQSVEAIKARAQIAAANAPLYDPVGEARAAVSTARSVLGATRTTGDPQATLDAEAAVADAERSLQEAVNDRVKALLDARGQLALSRIDPDRGVAVAAQNLSQAKKVVDLMQAQGRPAEEIMAAMAEVNNAERALQDAVAERANSLIDIQSRLAEANAPLYAPFAQEIAALNAARAKMSVLRRSGGTRQQMLDAQATIAEAERALALSQNERAEQLLQVSGEIALTNYDPEDTIGIARQTLANAEANLALVQSQGRDALAVQQAYLEVLQARSALSEAIEQQAEDVANARYELASARANAAGNEVRAAAIAARQALYQLEHADTKQERLSARAALVNARAGQRDAIFNREIEDIEFGADIGRLTVQEQIRAYQRLLKTLDLNRDMRRDLKSRIAQLRNEAEGDAGDFDLRVGDIRLPTIYDVRRAIQGGINSRAAMNVTNAPTVNVYAAPGSAGPVGDVLDKTLGTNTKAAMRSAGII